MLHIIPAVAVILVGARFSDAQTPKSKFDSKVIALGVKFYKVDEIAKLTDCIDDSFYNIATMDEIKDMDSCLKPEGQTTMKLIDKVSPSAYTVLQNVYNKVIADIKTAKAAGKTKAAVMDIGYTTIAGQVTKPLMEKLCTTLIPIITGLEWRCYLSNIKSLIDMTLYECSKIVKT
ncbi:unnamed protein product [Haemonchus placei]|uniref:PMEI domain-containing protein n=1 Tax=Haemonchus placei TaxID=6290 RepID=A0A0N4WU14_HAEPC|nr:unnamed protein product [Haemonchus placei]